MTRDGINLVEGQKLQIHKYGGLIKRRGWILMARKINMGVAIHVEVGIHIINAVRWGRFLHNKTEKIFSLIGCAKSDKSYVLEAKLTIS